MNDRELEPLKGQLIKPSSRQLYLIDWELETRPDPFPGQMA